MSANAEADAEARIKNAEARIRAQPPARFATRSSVRAATTAANTANDNNQPEVLDRFLKDLANHFEAQQRSRNFNILLCCALVWILFCISGNMWLKIKLPNFASPHFLIFMIDNGFTFFLHAVISGGLVILTIAPKFTDQSAREAATWIGLGCFVVGFLLLYTIAKSRY